MIEIPDVPTRTDCERWTATRRVGRTRQWIKGDDGMSAAPETAVENMMRRLLAASQHSLEVATTPDRPEAELQWACSHATLAAMCAYVLEALHINDQGEADEVAWQLHLFAEDGEPLADWVAQVSQAWGVRTVGAPEETT